MVNESPVPLVSSRDSVGGWLAAGTPRDQAGYLDAMGSVGTLFSIVNRTSTSVAKVCWRLYEDAASGIEDDRTPVAKHAMIDLWNMPVKPFYTGALFRETQQQHMDLVGEAWWVIARDPRFKVPLEMWPIRPDRMRPVPHATKYIAGYEYTSPSGEVVPLGLQDVIFLRMPNPSDPYRGMGPVQAILADLDSERYSAEWNRNFFRNSAEPGGVVAYDRRLDDDEFDQVQRRWNSAHRGTSAAHRVAILEQGATWIDRKFTQRDMQFAQLRDVSRSVMREAYGMPKFMLGGDEGSINRATAEAGMVLMGLFLTTPRCDRMKDALNYQLAPMYGSTAEGLGWDYDSPVPRDEAAENAELTTRVNSAKTMIDAGADPVEVCEWLEIPLKAFEKKAPPTPSTPPQQPPAETDETPEDRGLFWLAAERPGPPVDLSKLQSQWTSAVDRLMRRWQAVIGEQLDSLIPTVRHLIEQGDIAGLLALQLPAGIDGQDDLFRAATELAAQAADHAVGEARVQGVRTHAGTADTNQVGLMARLTAGLLAAQTTLHVAREALRLWRPGADAAGIATQVRDSAETMAGSAPRPMLGAGLTRAQTLGRAATFAQAPAARYYASEQLDTNTCANCKSIDGEELPTLDAAMTAYGGGPYFRCQGTWRCRGTFVAVFEEGS